MLALHGLCARPACRRACACRCEPRDCLARYAPLVPENVSDGVKAMLDGQRYSLSYNDVREDAPDDVAAVEQWMALIAETSRPPVG